jgi:O-antigen/teichoic acid export membrane protein
MGAVNGSALQRATSAARASFMMSPLIAVAALGANVIVVRALSPGDFALFAVALSLRATLQFLADMGTGAASSRSFAELQQLGSPGQARRLYGRLAGARLLIVVMLLVAMLLNRDAFASLLGLQSDEHYFLTFVALIGIAEVAAGLGYYVLIGTFGHRVAYSVVLAQNLLQPALVIGANVAGLGLPGILGAVVAGSFLRAVGFNLMALRALGRIEDSGRKVEGLGKTYARVSSGSVTGKLAAWIHSRQVVSVIAISSVSRPQVAVFAAAYDLVHQIFSFLSSPFYSLLLPAFSVAARDHRSAKQMLQMSVRALALISLPAAAIFTPLFTSLAVTLFGDEYAEVGTFGLVLLPALAVEVIVSGPASVLMLVREPLIAVYRKVKLVTLALGFLYFALAGVDLLVIAGIMMAIRVSSALVLQVVIWRRTGIGLPGHWLVRAVASALVTAGVALALAQLLPGRWLDLTVAPLAAGLVFLGLVRAARLAEAEDAAMASRIAPVAGRLLKLLMTEQARRDAARQTATAPAPGVAQPLPPYGAIE